jgi:CRISPR-associated protein Cas2
MNLTVIHVQNAPPHTHGVLSRWMLHVAPGLYVGTLNRRVRERLWTELKDIIEPGRAALVYPSNTEQRFTIETYGVGRYEPIEMEGITLVLEHSLVDNNTEQTRDFPVDW